MKASSTITIPKYARMHRIREAALREFVNFFHLQPALKINRIKAFYIEDLDELVAALRAVKSSLSL